jgi:hypothetical protein
LTGKDKNDFRSNVVYTGGTASWYGTPQQAETFAGTIPGAQVMDVSSKLPAAQINPNNIQTQVAQPRNLMSLLPQDWGSITDPQKKIAWFNQQKATDAELLSGGVGQGDIDWMRQHGFGKYAHGGRVQMEDGGFVMTKRAVDGAGGPQGIQQLVPGARMIRGPGTGTSDDIPAVINGRNGQTPARLSNGEAYVPKPFVDRIGGARRMYALMNKLQRRA